MSRQRKAHGMTAKQESEIGEWKEAEERHMQERITKRNGMDQRMTKVRGEAFRHSCSYGGSHPGTFSNPGGRTAISQASSQTLGDGRALAEIGAAYVRVG